MSVLVEGMLSLVVAALAGVVRLFRSMWPDGPGRWQIEPLRVGAAVSVTALAAPLLWASAELFRARLAFAEDEMLMFIGLLLVTPLLWGSALLAAVGAAAIVAVAIGLLGGHPGALPRAWAVLAIGVVEVLAFADAGRATPMAAATVATVAELGFLLAINERRRRTAPPGGRLTA